MSKQKIELEEGAPKKSFLDNEPFSTFEDVARYKSLYRQPRSPVLGKPCKVTSEFYELITEGENQSPLFWMGDNKQVPVPIIDVSRESEALDLLGGGKQLGVVVV